MEDDLFMYLSKTNVLYVCNSENKEICSMELKKDIEIDSLMYDKIMHETILI